MSTSTSIVITAQAGQAEGTMRSLGNSIDGVSKKMLDMSGLAGTLGGALSLTAFATFVSRTVAGIDALNDMSDATGASIENLSALEEMAARTGTSFDTVGSALIKFNQTLAGATPGSPAEQSLKAIGLNVEELKRLDPAEALRVTAVALSGFADDGNKARLVQELFGKSVREVAPLLKDLAEQGKLAGTVTSEMAAEADQFNKNLAVMQTNLQSAARALTTDLITGINKAAQALKDSGLVEGLATLLTGDDEYKNNKRLVELTNDLLRAENALSQSRARDAQFGDKSLATAAAEKRLASIKAELEMVQGYRKVLESGPTGQPTVAASGAAPGVPTLPDPAKSKANAAEAEKLSKQWIDGWVKYADAVLEEGERIDAAERANLEKFNAREAEKLGKVVEGFNSRNQTLAEMVAQQDLTEEERILYKRDQEFARLEEEKAILMAHNQWTLEMEQQYAQARLNAQSQASKAFVKLEKNTAQQKEQALVGSLGMISSLMSSSNQEQFKIGQAAAIANATISTYNGAMKAIDTLGPWGWPLAAATIVAGLAQVQKIANTKIGGGTPSPVNATFGGGSVATGTAIAPITSTQAAPNATVAAAQQQSINFHFTGSSISMEQMVNEFIPRLEEAYSNGAGSRVVFNVTRG
ncbi:MAG: hypothetical protein K2Y15_05910 [Burkholderiaceae bacterium]|nr:hypothetical protein [Burkholderiaceae bacterium]